MTFFYRGKLRPEAGGLYRGRLVHSYGSTIQLAVVLKEDAEGQFLEIVGVDDPIRRDEPCPFDEDYVDPEQETFARLALKPPPGVGKRSRKGEA